jgi:predicted amidophosphoribosyltransferase
MGLYESSIPNHPAAKRHYFLCHYLPITAGIDTPSRSLLKFKRGAQPDLDAWIDCALHSLHEISPALSPDTVIIRALHHNETSLAEPVPAPSALDLLGHAIATQFNCRYIPSLLTKTRTTRQNKGLSVEERYTELQDTYCVATDTPHPAGDGPSTGLAPSTPFLLIDDLLTTGATANAIIDTLSRTFPACPICIFTLGKAGYSAAVSQQFPLMGYTYRLDKETGWKQSC